MTRARDMANLIGGGVTISETVTASAFIGDGSALTNLPAAGISAVVDDTTPQLGGNLDTNGNNITFGDSVKATFGASSDLQIYHSGANSFVSDQGTGNLYLATNGTSVNITKGNGVENMGVFTADGAVTLYHNNIAKIATTTTGVDVTGDVSVSGGVYLGGTGSANYLDDYEEGTWTPTNPSGFSAGATYTQQAGHYTKIGNQVFVDFFIQFNVATGDSSVIQVGGLPFQLANDTRRGGGLSTYQSVVSGKTFQFYGQIGGNFINAFIDGNTQAVTSASVNSQYIIGCYTYLTP